MVTSKVTRNFQITIPKAIRKTMRIKEGDFVRFFSLGESAEIIKVKDRSIAIEEAAGLWKDMEETGVEYVRRVRKGWERNF